MSNFLVMFIGTGFVLSCILDVLYRKKLNEKIEYKLNKLKEEIIEKLKKGYEKPEGVSSSLDKIESIENDYEIRENELCKACILAVLRDKVSVNSFIIDSVLSDNRYADIRSLRDLEGKIESQLAALECFTNSKDKVDFAINSLGFTREEIEPVILK